MQRKFRCTHCLLSGQRTYQKRPAAFGCNAPEDIEPLILSHGAWTRCLECTATANSLRTTLSTPVIDANGIKRCGMNHSAIETSPYRCVCCGTSTIKNTFPTTHDVESQLMLCNDCHLHRCYGTCGQRKIRRNHFIKNEEQCNACTVENNAREQRLAALMRTSKRAHCTCHPWLVHSERCLLHIQRFGERTYPGCDVMSEADSTWLLKRRRRK